MDLCLLYDFTVNWKSKLYLWTFYISFGLCEGAWKPGKAIVFNQPTFYCRRFYLVYTRWGQGTKPTNRRLRRRRRRTSGVGFYRVCINNLSGTERRVEEEEEEGFLSFLVMVGWARWPFMQETKDEIGSRYIYIQEISF